MPKMLTKEEMARLTDLRNNCHTLGCIDGVLIQDGPREIFEGFTSLVLERDLRLALSHIDALTERLEGMADELDRYEDCTMDASYDLGLEVGAAHAAEELRALIKEMQG